MSVLHSIRVARGPGGRAPQIFRIYSIGGMSGIIMLFTYDQTFWPAQFLLAPKYFWAGYVTAAQRCKLGLFEGRF